MKFVSSLPSWANWGLAFPLIVLNGWLLLLVFRYFESILSIFIIANLLAFILNYLVEFLLSYHIKRSRAILLVVAGTFVIVSLLGLTIAPILIQQLNDLLQRLPSWIQSGVAQLQGFDQWAITHNLPVNIDILVTELTQRLSNQLQSLTGNILSFVLGTVGSVLEFVLTIVLTFYLLLHGEELWDGIIQWLPQPTGTVFQNILRQKFHNYYVGQASLSLIIGLSMTIAFLLLKIPFGLLFGLGMGFMGLFPFGVAFSIVVVSTLMALSSFWLGVKVLVVTTIIQQIIENGVAPRLLGGAIGLNPIWILVALLIGAKVGGILGLLIAVPFAGFIKTGADFLRSNPIGGEQLILDN
jgi:predicted PurR-regulated permease PerM